MDFSILERRIAEESREESLWYLAGALGDGTLYFDSGRYVVEYGQRCVEWLRYAVGLRLAKFGKPYLVRHRSSYWKIKVYSKELYSQLLDRWVKVRTSPPVDRDLIVKFIRGFFDAEGTIARQDKRRVYIRMAQKDRALLEAVKAMLAVLGISTTEVFRSDRYGTYALQISSGDVRKFVEIVGTDHPLKHARAVLFLNLGQGAGAQL